MSDLVVAINRYSERFHAGLTDHHIASPLGAWMLTALAAGPDSDSTHRQQLEEALGLPLEEAFTFAHSLLQTVHPAVKSAAAVWNAEAFDSDKVQDLQSRLSDVAQVGGIPTQDEADAWTREKTLDLIDKFPAQLTPDVLLVLATALATKIKWLSKFDVLEENTLRFGKSDTLHTDCSRGHHGWLQETEDGIVAVHRANSEDGLAVYSVIADPSVPSEKVLAHAHRIATDYRYGDKVRLFDVVLGSGHSWRLWEDEEVTENVERYTATLPAWTATSKHDLMRPELGIPSAASALTATLKTPQDTSTAAVQSAVASYGAEGFEAAALSTMIVSRSAASLPTRQTVRHCDIRFDHAYAVVAVAEKNWRKPSPWDNIPVFSAWVSDPK